MKLGLINWKHNINESIKNSLVEKGIRVVEDKKSSTYEALNEQWESLKKRSIDILMLSTMERDFNFFLDFLNPKKFKKNVFRLVGDFSTTTFLNYLANINKDNKVIIGPVFNGLTSESELFEIYDDFARILSTDSIEIDAKDQNNALDFSSTENCSGILTAWNIYDLLNALNTDYFNTILKGKILLLDNLPTNKVELRTILTALNQKKVFSNVKGAIFAKTDGIDVKEFISADFTELERLNLVYNFAGFSKKYVYLNKEIIIDKDQSVIIQKI